MASTCSGKTVLFGLILPHFITGRGPSCGEMIHFDEYFFKCGSPPPEELTKTMVIWYIRDSTTQFCRDFMSQYQNPRIFTGWLSFSCHNVFWALLTKKILSREPGCRWWDSALASTVEGPPPSVLGVGRLTLGGLGWQSSIGKIASSHKNHLVN